MDLELRGRSAILMASSRGLGRACAHSLAREGVDVVVNGRTAADVDQTCQELRDAYDITATGVVGDATSTAVHDDLLDACPKPDIVLLNGEGPSPKAFADIVAADWEDTVQRTMVSPLLFVQRVIGGMQEREFGRIVAISSAMVKSPNPLMSLSHGPRLGLTGVLKGLSKTAVAHNVTINTMLPERFDTGRQEQMAQLVMRFRGVTYEEARAEQVASINAGRLGKPEEFGDTFAFICSAQASFMSGQAIQLDGGSFVGLF
jgi:3-oxoacyl-[acyl-carrier protein] reductase